MVNDHVYVSVLHYPAVNKEGRWVCTSFTTLDFHDIARPARTYELAAYYIIQPLETQQFIIKQQINYWTEGFGASFNPRRSMAGEMVRVRSSLTEVIQEIEKDTGKSPKLIGTSAKIYPQTVSYSQMRDIIQKRNDVFLILFGTGWGMPQELVMSCDYILEPILGAGNYNHLSVRNAAAIIMDRLLSPNRCK
ncbi:MAG: RNA methyltransferase [Hydrogenothermaceae bacterium]|nr:RNA methyltransferase [Hydrogenothermaceae bacterium]